MLNRVLFILTLGFALILIGLVVCASWLRDYLPPVLSPMLELFIHDPAIRRTALGCGIGFVVTALVFFRHSPSREKPSLDKDIKSNKRSRSSFTIGA